MIFGLLPLGTRRVACVGPLRKELCSLVGRGLALHRFYQEGGRSGPESGDDEPSPSRGRPPLPPRSGSGAGTCIVCLPARHRPWSCRLGTSTWRYTLLYRLLGPFCSSSASLDANLNRGAAHCMRPS